MAFDENQSRAFVNWLILIKLVVLTATVSLAKSTLSTTIWASVEKIGMMGIQFIISMVLARLLTPTDYGAIAILMVFIAIAQVFIESGFGAALIRKQDCSIKDYSTAFYFNFAVGVICYIILFFFAPLISEFYHMEMLTPILRVYGLSLIFNSLTIVQNAILTKRLEFKMMARCSIISSILSGGIALIMAYSGFGVWALVLQTISSAFFLIITLELCTKWKPVISFSKKSFKYLWSFGSKALASSLISSLYANVYSLVIGKFYTEADLGYFNRGQSTAGLAPNIVNSIFNKSTLPLLSKVQDDREALVALYRKFSQLVAFISFPLVFLMIAIAKPFILFVLTEKWADAIPYVQIFSLAALTSAIGMINLNLLVSLGRTDLTLKANLIKKSLGFVMVGMLIFTSPIILAIGCMLFDIFVYFVNLYFAKYVINIKYSIQLQDLMPYLLASIGMMVFAMIPLYIFNDNFVQLIASTATGLISYFLITYYIIKSPFYHQLFYLLKTR